jgi:hypothetical protein
MFPPTTRFSNSLPSLNKTNVGHRAHIHLLRDGAGLVDIDLDEAHVGIGFAELADGGGDGLAGTAPGGEEVDDDRARGGQGLEDDGTNHRRVG